MYTEEDIWGPPPPPQTHGPMPVLPDDPNQGAGRAMMSRRPSWAPPPKPSRLGGKALTPVEEEMFGRMPPPPPPPPPQGGGPVLPDKAAMMQQYQDIRASQGAPQGPQPASPSVQAEKDRVLQWALSQLAAGG